MPDIIIKKVGRAGWITLNRPKALNALTYDMILKIENALEECARTSRRSCGCIYG